MTVRWIDLVDPSPHDLAAVLPAGADSDAVLALAARTRPGRDPRPSVTGHGAFAIALLAVPALDPTTGALEIGELDVVVAQDVIVTIRKSTTEGESTAVPPTLAEPHETTRSAGALFHAVVDDLADGFLDVLDEIYGEIDRLEDEVEGLASGAIRRQIAALRHKLLRLRRAASGTRAVTRRVLDGRIGLAEPSLLTEGVEHGLIDTYETLVRVTEELDVARDLLSSVRDYHQAKIAEGQSEIGKRLTVVASLVLVPGFIVGFYGQNFAGEFRAGYWNIGVSTGLIAATTLLQLTLFRWRRWI